MLTQYHTVPALYQFFIDLPKDLDLHHDDRVVIVNRLKRIMNTASDWDELDTKNTAVRILSHVFYNEHEARDSHTFLDPQLQIDLLTVLNEKHALCRFPLSIEVASLALLEHGYVKDMGMPYGIYESATHIAQALLKGLKRYRLVPGGHVSPMLIATLQGSPRLVYALASMGIGAPKSRKEERIILDMITEQASRGEREQNALKMLDTLLYNQRVGVSHDNIVYAIKKNRVTVVQAMLKKYARYHSVDIGHLVITAVRHSRSEATALAVLDHCDTSTCMYKDVLTGSTALHFAASAGYARVVRRILKIMSGPFEMIGAEGSFHAHLNNCYETPLMLACRNGNPHIVRDLLHVKGSMHTHSDLLKALDIAVAHGREGAKEEVLKMLVAMRLARRWRSFMMRRVLGETGQGLKLPGDILKTIVGLVVEANGFSRV
jgi:hypothetical protein